jgi:ABC-type antimicrobial peptide transport system permease subunit
VRADDLLREAVRGVRLRPMRSALTAAAFAAGTAAAVALLAITGGARAEILRRIEALGIDLIAVRPVGEPAPGDPPPLTYGDAEDLRRSLAFVRAIAPVRVLDSDVLMPSERVSVRVVGATAELFALRRLRFERGRAFSAQQVARGDGVCVLGALAARRLVPSGDAYGALVKIGGNWYRVIGVLAPANLAEGGPGNEDENAGRDVYLPITQTFAADAFHRQALAEAWIAVDGRVDPEAAAPVLERALERRHGGRQHFAVTTAARLLAEHRATRGLLNQLLLLMSLAAFALGGVGMMTVSWQNVRNRTREIAIRRAVGARRGEVLAQFVLEGIALGLAGALLGVVVGLAGSGVASWIGGWPWMLSPLAGLLALAVALAVATLSTLYPAAHAAALDPVSALRLDR